ncbi:anthranilate synthase component I [Deinococcus soli (ex Cha et al. 2016)]|uniref:Anthranilate synthase component 1 n=2 Tax=Deinococcus soli (ex Cha et al. 2016) TaxID=1309411 RepID=A0ACC6KCD3_9DEIO|nr:anthranilate synthase component I [Deinococcus soli (ex Cha et al. 2016)]MDR6217021.1 anthranilate synthase component 1 [Deinococcus soli (ex Cha et al. 2016)]MDR6327842.1 anthranilate synthase component 1 [Deinococcus soli (ex Cha et al. 2016)]MDR6750117.1 anthranilate synthase component 1 [Deinococcus soli (ex Cha et al. 2016)]GGB54153.1 anthranilate synthase component I [Deinococcus soli (ex Cha et al. 2016)]
MTQPNPRSPLAVAVQELNADLDTPVTAYLKVAQGETVTFLLESVEAGEKLGRYSFIGVGEQGRFEARGAHVTSSGTFGDFDGQDTDPLARLYHATVRPATVPGGLPALIGGAIGYAAYDLIRNYERLPDENPDELNVPDACFIAPRGMVIFDHLKHRLITVATADTQAGAQEEVQRLTQRLRGPLPAVPGRTPTTPPEFTSNFTPDTFQAAVRAALEYIRAGDIFQVVPSQRFSADLGDLHPFALYRALRRVNPSPYLGYLQLGPVTLVASSPESLLASDGQTVTTRPIAGTRPRGATPEHDQALADELLADEKERAEHLMLVDLGRNDLGKVSRFGSVRVHDAFTIERYSHVMHIVSSVTATLRDDQTPLHALASVQPMGTVSGAPKIRAMQIIDELEPVRRGPYGGSFGYIALNGSMDMALTLRTMVITNGRVHIQAGAGVVADSDPASEEQETRNKAAALMRAVELAAGGL